jgi:glycerophosphoryl diester phosphodiesterase
MRAPIAVALAAAAVAAPPASALEVFAHRGGPVVDGYPAFPENTLPAFRHAAREGTALELDVRLTLDGVPLVVHDATFDRTTTCAGPVAAWDAGAAARECRALWPARRTTTSVPRLDQVLAVAARHRVRAMIEVKAPQDARAVVDAIRASRLPRHLAIVQSFRPGALSVAQRRWPGVATALLSTHARRNPALRRAAKGFTYVAPRWPVTRGYVAVARAVGLRVLPFGLWTGAAVRRAVAVGVDAFIAEDPTAARRELRGG